MQIKNRQSRVRGSTADASHLPLDRKHRRGKACIETFSFDYFLQSVFSVECGARGALGATNTCISEIKSNYG